MIIYDKLKELYSSEELKNKLGNYVYHYCFFSNKKTTYLISDKWFLKYSYYLK